MTGKRDSRNLPSVEFDCDYYKRRLRRVALGSVITYRNVDEP